MTIRSRSTLRPAACLTLALLCASAGTAHGQTRARPVDAERERALLRARLNQSFVLADFNRDGLHDVAIADFLTDQIRIRLGEAGGSFGRSIVLPTGRGPRAIVAADLDGDQALDLAVTEFFAGSVRVFTGQGDGRFTEPRTVPVASGPAALLAGDFDGDSRTDLVVAAALSGDVVLLKNASDGAWTPASIGRTHAPTLLLSRGGKQDDSQDVVAVNADGSEAHVFAARSAGRTDKRGRIVKMAGDGQAAEAGRVSPETLIVQVKDLGGAASAGETVSFSVLNGNAGLVDAVGQDARPADARLTDDHGHAAVQVLLPSLPDVSVVAAALPVDEAAGFGVLAFVEYDAIVERIMSLLVQQIREPDALARHRARLSSALAYVKTGDGLAAVRDVSASLELLEREDAGGDAAELERRLINQVLIAGVSPQLAENRPILCDTPTRTTLASPTEVDRFTFSATAAEVIHITLANEGGTLFNPLFRVIAPNGTMLSGCGFSTNLDCRIPATGSYAVEVVDGSSNGTGTYSLHIQRLTAGFRCGGSITCDVPLTTTVGTVARADTNIHSFSAVAGERVHVTLGNQGGTLFNPLFRVIAPSGAVVPGCGFSTNLDCALPQAGSYAVEVLDGSTNGSGTYSLHIQRLTAGRRCGGSIECDVPLTTTVGTVAKADTNIHSFSAVASERVHVTLGNQGGTLFNPLFRVIAPNGTVVPGCGFSTNLDCALPAAGSYAVEVLDGSTDGSGTYSLHIQRLTSGRRCGGSIACDVPLTTTVGTVARADTNIHSFSAAANERMHVIVANHGGTLFNPLFRVIAPNGTVVPGCGFSTNLDCVLPQAGSYAVEVLDGSTNGSGTYSLHIQRLTANWRCNGQARCGVPVRPVPLGGVTRADTDLWSFGAAAGTVRVTFANLGGTNFNPLWRVVAPNGTTVQTCGFTGRTLADCVLPVDGAYAVQVLDGSLDGTGRYELTVSGAACRGLPNVTVSSLTCGAPTAPGSSITVNVRTANIGDAAAPASTAGVYLSLDNAVGGDTALLPKISVPALAAGASALVPVVVPIPAATAPGKNFILAQADDPHVIPEGDEMNNVRACPLTIGADLVVSSVVAPASAVRGAAVAAAITVRNNGGAASAATTMRLHFSTDNVVSAGDVAANVQVVGLGPNQAATVNATITIPAAAPVGTRFLIAVADALGIVREADERNNNFTRSIVVQ